MLCKHFAGDGPGRTKLKCCCDAWASMGGLAVQYVMMAWPMESIVMNARSHCHLYPRPSHDFAYFRAINHSSRQVSPREYKIPEGSIRVLERRRHVWPSRPRWVRSALIEASKALLDPRCAASAIHDEGPHFFFMTRPLPRALHFLALDTF